MVLKIVTPFNYYCNKVWTSVGNFLVCNVKPRGLGFCDLDSNWHLMVELVFLLNQHQNQDHENTTLNTSLNPLGRQVQLF
jgi:hypothetical protein